MVYTPTQVSSGGETSRHYSNLKTNWRFYSTSSSALNLIKPAETCQHNRRNFAGWVTFIVKKLQEVFNITLTIVGLDDTALKSV